MTTFYLIRHAKSKGNEEQIYGTDPNLSPEGCQTALLTKFDFDPDTVISSTKKRAIQTAFLNFKRVGKTLPEFDEIFFGSLEDQTVDYENRNAAQLLKEHGGDDLNERAQKAIKSMLELAPDYNKIAIITHETLMQSIVSCITQGDAEALVWGDDLYVPNLHYIKIGVEKDGAVKILGAPGAPNDPAVQKINEERKFPAAS